MEKDGENSCMLLNQFNLFAQRSHSRNIDRRKPKPPKTEIKIVFQHPNLLYLSDKKVRTK